MTGARYAAAVDTSRCRADETRNHQALLGFVAPATTRDELAPGAVVLRGFALAAADDLIDAVERVWAAAPPRHMSVPGGGTMSAAMTNCGALGWVADASGYRYTACDPASGTPWPALPDAFLRLADDAARAAGFDGFLPDACLVNRYAPGARMGLHRDADEPDGRAPIVSVSLGLPATFLWGGATRRDPVVRVPLEHGDVLVFGGPSRRTYHGVAAVREGVHPRLGAVRVNLTLRRASAADAQTMRR